MSFAEPSAAGTEHALMPSRQTRRELRRRLPMCHSACYWQKTRHMKIVAAANGRAVTAQAPFRRRCHAVAATRQLPRRGIRGARACGAARSV